MLVGNFKHTIDTKGRVFLPAKYREDLGQNILLIKGSHDCLIAFSENEWKNIVEEMTKSLDKQAAADAKRKLMKQSQLIEPDAQGRIVISSEMRELGNLTKDIVFVGMDNCVEIWDATLLYAKDDDSTSDINTDNYIKSLGL